MALLQFLNSKCKAVIVFMFSIIAIAAFIVTTFSATLICAKWYGLIIGIFLMLAAVPCHITGKKNRAGYLFSFVLNSVGNGFSASALYLQSDIPLPFVEALIPAVPAAGILLLVYLLLQIFSKTKRFTVTTAVIINCLLIAALVVLWIMKGPAYFSFGLFCLIISLFYLCVFGITLGRDERSVLRDISFGSFGSFIILTVVVIFVLSEGEILDGFDIDIPRGKKGKKLK